MGWDDVLPACLDVVRSDATAIVRSDASQTDVTDLCEENPFLQNCIFFLVFFYIQWHFQFFFWNIFKHPQLLSRGVSPIPGLIKAAPAVYRSQLYRPQLHRFLEQLGIVQH